MLKCDGATSRHADCEAVDETAVAGYIAEMTAQMESMASAAGLDLLAYFLAMARAEGQALARAPAAARAESGASGQSVAGGKTSEASASRNRTFRALRAQKRERTPR